jgi:hypothetical protein
MRVIAEIPHPACKITLFSMNQKYIIKFELGLFEQSYKIAEMDLITGTVEEVQQMIDDTFVKTVMERFSQMRSDFHSAYERI